MTEGDPGDPTHPQNLIAQCHSIIMVLFTLLCCLLGMTTELQQFYGMTEANTDQSIVVTH